MSEAKFTPGPWLIDDTGSVVTEDGGYVAEPFSGGTERFAAADGSMEANALLIAAAPDLYTAHLAACDAANALLAPISAETCGLWYEAPDMDLVPVLQKAGVRITGKMLRALYDATDRAALAKARGEA